MANRCFGKHARQVTHALYVLVGVVLVNVHLCLDLPHELHQEVLLYSNFSYSCYFKCLVWHRCSDDISTKGSPDYFHRFSSNEIRAYKIELEYLSAVQDPEPLSY